VTSHDIVPAAAHTPEPAGTGTTPARAKPTFSEMVHGVLNYVTLAGRFMALAAAAVFLKEKLHLLKHHMHKNAEAGRRLADHLHQAGADTRFQAQSVEMSQAFDRVAEASGILADAADQMEANARGVRDAHQAEYGGIYEVAQSSPYEQPKPGFNTVR
jgi:hypothetical protein